MNKLAQLLENKKEVINKEWISSLNAAYPIDAVGLMRAQNNSFLNPIGGLNSNSTSVIYNALITNDVDISKVKQALTELIELRAIQSMSASQALAGIIIIKTLIQKHIFTELENKDYRDYFDLIDKIDGLILIALDIYAQSLEKVYRIRVDEIKNAQSQILRLAQKHGYSAN